jgi:rubredoxin
MWNYANAYARHEWKAKRRFVNYAGPGGLAGQTSGAAKDLGLHSGTVQKVCAQFDTSKHQHGKAWLRFRGRKALGWVPFKGAHLQLEDGGFRFMKQRFQVWDSYGLGRFTARDGSLVQDALNKFSTGLVRQYGAIFVGDVSTALLLQFSPKSTLDAGHGILKNQLRYKSQQAGRKFAEVSEKWTTQTCSACGCTAGPKGRAGLNERAWVCPECGASHDRDVNAARNILALGLRHGPPAGGIRPL